MIQLGISAFYHDSAACLVVDGKVLLGAEEERFTEIKHDHSFPVNAILYVLRESGIQDINQIDEICWYEIPEVKKNRVLKTFNKNFFKTFKNRLRFLRDYHFKSPAKLLKKHFNYTGDITYVDHHLSHAGFSYYTSKYENAAILSVDGVGEWETVSIYHAKGEELWQKHSFVFPNSLGMLYSTVTSFLGFKPNEGEYKVMGLAPFGDPEKYYGKLSKIFTQEYLEIDQKYFTWEYSDRIMFNMEFCKLLGLAPRFSEEPIEQEHKDLAAALQKIYEREFEKLVILAKNYTSTDNICLSGGCAYNGVANKLAYKHFKSVHIPYAPSDAGSAIGACLVSRAGKKESFNVTPYLGPRVKDSDFLPILSDYKDKLSWQELKFTELTAQVAKLLDEQNIVAWVQGRMEFGARALGNRSILASPKNASMRDKLNRVIKKREGFRPFAPSVTLETAFKHFNIEEPVPYMNIVVTAKDDDGFARFTRFPAATHIDGTCRVQTVTPEMNSRYHQLLKAVGRQTGDEVLLNTSFNLKDQTITVSGEQAIKRYLDSDIDYLVINNYLISKR